jgi:alpha-D-ribose 1-methylphosphonate 5-triphosphate diphosphatase
MTPSSSRAGTTTVLDSLSVGASMKRPERREILEPLIAALDEGQRQGLSAPSTCLHLRCEVSDPATMALLDATAEHPLTRLVSVMDHTPGDRQSPDIDRWFTHMIHEMEVDEATGRDMMDDLLARSRTRGAEVRAHVVASATEAGVTIMSHDDRTEAHVDQAVAEGIHVSEFPCTLAAARRARAQRHGHRGGRAQLPARRLAIGQCGGQGPAGRGAGRHARLRLRAALAAGCRLPARRRSRPAP